MKWILIAALLMLHLPYGAASANELAPTPQMGFNNWYSTFCRAEFNEDMIRGVVDKMVSSGLKEAGYNYVNLDDCWAESDRDKNGNLMVNAKRFPHGLKALGEYIHSKGMKFGIYTSAGTFTCQKREEGGFPGSLGHEVQDAALFAAWFATPQFVRFPNGESLQDLAARTADALRMVLARHPDETVVLVGHESVNRTLLLQLLEQPLSAYWRVAQEPCCLNEIDVSGGTICVLRINETSHLEA